jgi:KDO2-lipid IV(A) lauroyltransferase
MGHLGSWEITAMILALRIGTKGAAIIRRADNPFLNWLIRRLRLQAKSQWIEKRGAVAESIRRLQQGNSIAVLLDENGGWHGPFVQFFGRAASTRKTAALLSLTTGAPIVIGAAIRKPVSKKFLFKLALIEPSQYDRRPESIRQMTEEIVRIYEQWIREYPLQWRWIHWRWKNRPGGQEETYTWRDLQECFSLRTP